MLNSTSKDAGHATCPLPEGAGSATPAPSLAERRARALAPTIFCPASNVEQCVRQAMQAGMSR